MSNLLDHAKREMAFLRSGEPDEMQDAIERDIYDIIERFGSQGHSGSSASYAIRCLEKLLRFEPLTPLTGAEDEWNDISQQHGGGTLWQNRRCSHVFKDADGAYDIQGKVFVEPDGYSFTSRDSRVPVTFPYVPKTEYVKVEAR